MQITFVSARQYLVLVGVTCAVFSPQLALECRAQSTAEKIIVMPISASAGVPAAKAKLLDEVYLTALSQVIPKQATLLGASDIQAILFKMQERQRLGCSDEACLAEIGNALGANLMISSSLGRMGDSFIINTKLVATNEVRVLYRGVVQTARTDEALLQGVRTLAREMATSMDWSNKSLTASTASSQQTKSSTVSQRSWLFWPGVGATAAGALLGGAAVAGIIYFNGQAADTEKTILQRQQAATVGLVLGGVVAVAVVVTVAGAAGVIYGATGE